MLNYNTMRFLTDEFNPYIKQALLVSDVPIDLSNFNRLDQFTVLGNEPEGSKRRFMFKMDNKVYTFNDQSLSEYTGSVDIDNVLAFGNSAAQVEAVRYNHQLVGKNIFPIIALYSESENIPSAKIVLSAANVVEQLDLAEEHTPMYFHDPITHEPINGTVLGFTWNIEINGNASGVFRVKLLQNDVWSDYMTITEARGQTARAIQAKWFYHVDAADGNNSVKIKRFNVLWSPDADSRVYGDVAYIYSISNYYHLNLSHAVLVVRHEDLEGGSLDADVSFESKRTRHYNISLGQLDSAEKIFTLDVDIFPTTLRIFLNNVETTDFEFDSANRTVTFSADNSRTSAVVTANFEAPCNEELWLPLIRDISQPTNNGLYTTRFALYNPDFDSKNLNTSLIRIKLTRGRNNANLSVKSTGVVGQSIPLPHEPDDIDCDAEYWTLTSDDNSNPCVVIYEDPPPAGSNINISYTWHGKTPVVRGWSVVWSA